LLPRQGVVGSNPITRSRNQIQNSSPSLTEIANKFLCSKESRLSQSTKQLYEYCLTNFAYSYSLNPEGINQFLSRPHPGNGKFVYYRVIKMLLRRLEVKTVICCNAHSFRKGFACRLHRRGLSTLDIHRLGGWESLQMVQRYTASISFEDCLVHYREKPG
jgi:integrase